MANCKDCVHVEACGTFSILSEDFEIASPERIASDCNCFKDRARFVELPADDKFRTVRTVDDLGRIVIPKRIRRELDINYGDPILFIPIDESKILLSKFTGSKEAEVSE